MVQNENNPLIVVIIYETASKEYFLSYILLKQIHYFTNQSKK